MVCRANQHSTLNQYSDRPLHLPGQLRPGSARMQASCASGGPVNETGPCYWCTLRWPSSPRWRDRTGRLPRLGKAHTEALQSDISQKQLVGNGWERASPRTTDAASSKSKTHVKYARCLQPGKGTCILARQVLPGHSHGTAQATACWST